MQITKTLFSFIKIDNKKIINQILRVYRKLYLFNETHFLTKKG